MVTLADIQCAAERIDRHIIHTPLVFSPTFSSMCGAPVYLKLETMQRAGSFKVRGAMNKVLSCREDIGVQGVVTASGGNHAQGVAVAAQTANVSATVVMPETAPLSKQEASRHYGATVILHGKNLQESVTYARELEKEGALFIHPYDDVDVIAGQGTIALEIYQDLPDADLIIVPVGGGGLISGIALAAKETSGSVQVIGVQAAACPSVYRPFYTGKIEEFTPEPSIADGITVKQPGEITLALIRRYVDSLVLASEEDLAEAMRLLLERKKIIAEGAGAAPLAALLTGNIPVSKNNRIVLVISGGNVDNTLLERIIRQGLLKKGKIMRLSVCLDDVPGSLGNLLGLIAQVGGNIQNINQVRGGRDVPLFTARVDLEIDTRSPDHIREICRVLEGAGYRIRMHDY
ncbi:MAG: threonine ammonia-lyase [Methanomicrobiales archaeon]|nr:threonine ammonia-lyase [Methanomicrobiales archaeon]